MLKIGDEIVITNKNKAELMVNTFVKIHSTENPSEQRRTRNKKVEL